MDAVSLFYDLVDKYREARRFIIGEYSTDPAASLEELEDECGTYRRELAYRLGLAKRPDPAPEMDMRITIRE